MKTTSGWLRLFTATVTAGLCLGFAARGGEMRLTDDPAGWRLVLGAEFPGAKGGLERRDGALCLSVDFTGGGRYAGLATVGGLPPFKALAFRVKGPCRQIGLRLVDSEKQTHQYDLPLDGGGGPDAWREVVFTVADSSRHWGGANDGKVRGLVREITLLVLAAHLSGQRGAVHFRDLALRGADPAGLAFDAKPADPERCFRVPGDPTPVRLKLAAGTVGLPPGDLAYAYTDYAGRTTATGRAEYRPEDGGMLLVPPPPAVGYHDLALPGLGIRSSVVVDRPAPSPADEYFGIDVAQSRGGPRLDDEAYFASLFRSLRANGIRWIRERMTPGELQPAADRFDFEARGGHYRKLRELAAREGLRILDVFHDAPAWNKRLVSDADDYIPGGDTHGAYSQGSNLYPRDLIAAAAGIDAITRRLLPDPSALEVWNEPNIAFGNAFPGEFPVALTKAVAARFGRTGNAAALVGGVFSEAPLLYYDRYVANGLPAHVDAVSYHDYWPVDRIEGQVARLRDIERQYDPARAGLPYWITEAGFSWPRGGDRPEPDDARRSAAEIVGKAVEYRALGIRRYFAFVYRFYNEHQRNHGMMDAHDAPLHSLAAYAHLARVLANKEYLGDLDLPGVVRSRMFGDAREQVVCLYAPVNPSAPPAAAALPEGVEVSRVEGIDGRPLSVTNGKIPLDRDGIVYLHTSAVPERLLDRNTRAMALYRQAKDYQAPPRSSLPVVIQPDYDMTAVDYNPHDLQIRPNQAFRARVWFNNLSGRPVTAEPVLTLPDGLAAEGFPGDAFRLAPESRRLVAFTLRPVGDRAMVEWLTVTVGDRRGNATPMVTALRQQPDPERFARGKVLELRTMEQSEHWRKNAAGDMTIRRDEAENAVLFTTRFPPNVDRWSYPEFLLPEAGLLKGAIAIGFEVKAAPADKIMQMLLMAVNSAEKERGPATHIRISRPTGDWEYRSVFFPDGIRPEDIRQLRLGVNALTDEVEVGLRNVRVFYTRP